MRPFAWRRRETRAPAEARVSRSCSALRGLGLALSLTAACGPERAPGSGANLEGLAPLRLDRVTPQVLATGSELSLVLAGEGFSPPLRVQIGNDSFDVLGPDSPRSFVVSRPADPSAAIGPVSITIRRADGSSVQSSGLFRYSARHVAFEDTAVLPMPQVKDSVRLLPPVVGDLDGDSLDDVVMVSADLSVELFRAKGDNPLGPPMHIVLPGRGAAEYAEGAAILHGPGPSTADRLVLLTVDKTATGAVAWLHTYTLDPRAGTATRIATEQLDSDPEPAGSLDIRDYDGDGADDRAVFYGKAGKSLVAVLTSDPRRSVPSPLRQELPARPSLVADLDRDGYPDLIILRPAGSGALPPVEFHWNALSDATEKTPWPAAPTRCAWSTATHHYAEPFVGNLGLPGQRRFGLLVRDLSDSTRLFIESGSGDRSRGCGPPLRLAENGRSELQGGSLVALTDWDGDDAVDAVLASGQVRRFLYDGRGAPRGLVPLADYRFGRLVSERLTPGEIGGAQALLGQVHAAGLSGPEGLLFLRPVAGPRPPQRYLSAEQIGSMTLLPPRRDGSRSLLLGSDRGLDLLTRTDSRGDSTYATTCPLPLGKIHAAVIEQAVSADDVIVGVLATVGATPVGPTQPVSLLRYRLTPHACWSLLTSTELTGDALHLVRLRRGPARGPVLAVLERQPTGFGTKPMLSIYAGGVRIASAEDDAVGAMLQGVNELLAADPDGDGRDELILRQHTAVYIGRGDPLDPVGLLRGSQSIPNEKDVTRVVIDDFTGDGREDLALVPSLSPQVRIYSTHGIPGGALALWRTVSTGPLVPGNVTVIGSGDVDSDGQPELLLSVGNFDWLLIQALPINGTVLREDAPVLARGSRVIAADLDGDARAELITLDPATGGGVVVFRNQSR